MQKLLYFGHLMRTENSEKSLILGKTEGRRRRGYQRTRWLASITDVMSMNLGKLQEMVRDEESWQAAVHGVAKSWTWLGPWTATKTLQNDPGSGKSNLFPFYVSVMLNRNFLKSKLFYWTRRANMILQGSRGVKYGDCYYTQLLSCTRS